MKQAWGNIQGKGRWGRIGRTIWKERELWLLSIPLLVWVFVFYYIPMYGLSMSFFYYIPGKSVFDCKFVGMRWFNEFFSSPDFAQIMRNTLVISGLGILIGFPAPILLALLLNEVHHRGVRKVIQTISYLPYFISWVVAAALITSLLGTEGVVNQMLLQTGITTQAISFLGEGRYFWGVITGANLWKMIGWNSIIYLSAISGIDDELYQAGAVDGLGRFGMVWHITLPGIRGTIVLLWILGIGNILNAGFEQQLLLGNVQTREYWDVIDTYAYRFGVGMGNYSFATAVGLFKSLISILLVVLTNLLSKKLMDVSIF